MSLPSPASCFKPVQQKTEYIYGPEQFASFVPNKVVAQPCMYKEKHALQVQLISGFTAETGYIADGPHFAYLPDIDFHDGIIELSLASSLAKDAESFARGFAGIGFRIAPESKHFEGLYVRPTNGRAADQVRRNHSVQYFSFPTYDFAYFRKHAPEKYESYCDLQVDTWMHMRIEVQAEKTRLYMHNAEQPCLLVDDLKLGHNARGGIGLWVDMGTVAHFADIKVTKWD